MEIKVNVNFRTMQGWKDSTRRANHVLDRMQLRGIGVGEIKEGVHKGAKTIRPDGVIECEYRWYKIVYREFHFHDVRKIYPITVMEV